MKGGEKKYYLTPFQLLVMKERNTWLVRGSFEKKPTDPG